MQRVAAVPRLGEQPVERAQSKLRGPVNAQNARRLKIGCDGHRVPAGVEGAIDEGRGPPGAGGEQLPPRGIHESA